MRKGLIGGALAALLFAMPAAALAQYFGAVAINPYGSAYGFSVDYPDRYSAEGRALAECGRGCLVATWFKNACGAAAVGYNGGWGASWGPNRAAAEYQAMSICSRNTSGCGIRAWACTTR